MSCIDTQQFENGSRRVSHRGVLAEYVLVTRAETSARVCFSRLQGGWREVCLLGIGIMAICT